MRPASEQGCRCKGEFVTISKVQLFSIPVCDQERARDFYVGVLGFEVLSDSELAPGQRWIQLRPPGAETAITLVTWFAVMPAGSLKGLVLESDDLEADVERLRQKGAVIDGEIAEVPWGRFVTFDDPDGNGLILQTTST